MRARARIIPARDRDPFAGAPRRWRPPGADRRCRASPPHRCAAPIPGGPADDAGGVRRRGGLPWCGALLWCGAQRGEHAVQERGQVAGATTASTSPWARRFSAVCTPGGNRARAFLIDPRPREADQRPGLGDRQVPQRRPGGEHPRGGGVPQIRKVRKVRGLVPETAAVIFTICRNAAVPSCIRVPPEAGRRSAAAVRRWPARSCGPGVPRRPRRSTRPGTELRRRDRHAMPADQAGPGDHRFV